jgi:hypothetical protein
VTLSDGDVIDIDVQRDGYFHRNRHQARCGSLDRLTPSRSHHLPEAVHVAALDAQGNVIDEKDLPGIRNFTSAPRRTQARNVLIRRSPKCVRSRSAETMHHRYPSE